MWYFTFPVLMRSLHFLVCFLLGCCHSHNGSGLADRACKLFFYKILLLIFFLFSPYHMIFATDITAVSVVDMNHFLSFLDNRLFLCNK